MSINDFVIDGIRLRVGDSIINHKKGDVMTSFSATDLEILNIELQEAGSIFTLSTD